MYVAGVDGCRAGWVAFKVEVPSFATSDDVVDLAELLSKRPNELSCIAIDIPIGLLNGSRACDKAARKLLGRPRGSSVFAVPVHRADCDPCSATGVAKTVSTIEVLQPRRSSSLVLTFSPFLNCLEAIA
jgi:predicted RNase H-like nuclease